MTVEKFIKAMKNETKAITFIVSYAGEDESFTKEKINDLIRIWGYEEVANYYMLNTREMVINIR